VEFLPQPLFQAMRQQFWGFRTCFEYATIRLNDSNMMPTLSCSIDTAATQATQISHINTSDTHHLSPVEIQLLQARWPDRSRIAVQ
jgi:hypothetical protein